MSGRLPALLPLLLCACSAGPPDPCADEAGACIALEVTSATINRIDTLRIGAFSATRLSASSTGAALLPVLVAVLPPAGTDGQVALHVEGLLGGAVVGTGDGSATLSGSAHVRAQVALTAPGGPMCGQPDDPKNCGVCGRVCSFPNASALCAGGACKLDMCNFGYDDCKNGPADGCETQVLGSDANNCGMCDKHCLLGEQCQTGVCKDNTPSCAAGGCVKPFCDDQGRYAVTDTIVVDLKNGRRLWERVAMNTTINWVNGSAYCDNLTLGGITRWRIPTLDELDSLVLKAGFLMGCGAAYCCPALDEAAFPNSQPDQYWTTMDGSGGSKVLVNFNDGRSNYKDDPVSGSHYLRCVHDPL